MQVILGIGQIFIEKYREENPDFEYMPEESEDLGLFVQE